LSLLNIWRSVIKANHNYKEKMEKIVLAPVKRDRPKIREFVSKKKQCIKEKKKEKKEEQMKYIP